MRVINRKQAYTPRRGVVSAMLGGSLGLVLAISAYIAANASPQADTPVPVESVATLDWDNAVIGLPLDEFGMTPAEAQRGLVAASIEFAKCVSGSEDVPPAAVVEAKRALSAKPQIARWLYGFWNHSYITKNGYLPSYSSYPALMKADDATFERCWVDEKVQSVLPISTSHASGDEFALLVRLSMESRDRALNDKRVTELQDKVSRCLVSQGYEADFSQGGVVISENWSDSQITEAVLAQAQCDDSVGLTPLAITVQGEFEIEAIDQYKSQLESIKSTARGRVLTANQALLDAGLK